MKFKIETSILKEKVLRCKPNTPKWWAWQLKENGFDCSVMFNISGVGNYFILEGNIETLVCVYPDSILVTHLAINTGVTRNKFFKYENFSVVEIIKYIEENCF